MPEKKHEKVRRFNRSVFNPVIKFLFAGRMIYALVYHQGRRSGKQYSTPVVAAKTGESIYIPLPYGADTDWYLNVRAAGRCEIRLKRRLYSAVNPELVDAATALKVFPKMLQRSLARAGVEQYLRIVIIGFAG